MGFKCIFKVFLRKNILYLRYNYLSLLIIFIGCLTIVFSYLGYTRTTQTTPEVLHDPKSYDILQQNFPLNTDDYIYYAPTSPSIDDFMEYVRIQLQISDTALKPVTNAAIMKTILEQNCRGNCFGIHFKNFPNKQTDSGKLRYALSSVSTRISPQKRYVNDDEINGVIEDDDYVRSGFLTLQHTVDNAYLRHVGGSQSDISMEISTFPSISQEKTDSQRLISFGSIFSVLFSVLLLATFLVPLVEEKQNGLKEFLIIATPLNFLNGVTFFLVRLTLYLIFLTIVVIFAECYNALGLTPIMYVILLFLLYMLSAMSYAYLISVCFHSVFYAKVGGLILFIIPYVFYMVQGGMSTLATYLFSTKTFLDGLKIFQTFSNKYRVFNANDLFTTNITEASLKMCCIYGILILQCLLYALLYNYLSCVFPGPGGLKKPYNFFLKRSFYKKKQRNQYTTSERGTDAIIIQDLVKKFKTPTRIIEIANRLNMVIKNKQITVLLGHNGVGKTTTLNMIMGSEPKDAGSILVCSERDVASYRHLIGFCPQHSVFMNYMNCQQHLEFFAMLRGMSKSEANKLSVNLLDELHLLDKASEFGRNLSGGMKRRLSLGIALAGETKIVILDEPSSGLDIESRRELWDLLLKLRKSKAILVTTHHMEEAEVLGDTICILSNGRVQRTGTPLDLKRKVGGGYILKLCVNMENFNQEAILRLIQDFVPEAKVLNIVPPTMLIQLPYKDQRHYADMLKKLENSLNALGITSISISDTSLEDVFLNCAAENDQANGAGTSTIDVDQVDGANNTIQRAERIPYQRQRNAFEVSRLRQIKAIFYKKLIFLRSEWIYASIMILLPILCTSLAILLIRSMSVVETESALPLNLHQIKSGRIYVRSASYDVERRLIDEIQKSNIVGLPLKTNETIAYEMLSMQRTNLADFLQNVIGVIDVSTDENDKFVFGIYYSSNIYHSSVILLNLVDSVVVQQATQGRSRIETVYAPIRRFITDISPTRLEYYAVIVPIGLFFYMFFYVTLPFRENESGFKNLQAVPRRMYWFTFFAFDMILHFIVCCLLGLVQYLLMSNELYSPSQQLTITISIFFYGFSYLPILYIFGNSFRSISTISTYMLFMFIVSAIFPLITSGNIAAMDYHETKIIFLSFLPDFNLNHQLRKINENFIINHNKLSSQEPLHLGSFFGYAIFTFLIAMFIFLYIVENKAKREALKKFFSCYKCRRLTTEPINDKEEGKNLSNEAINESNDADYPLIVRNVYKYYDNRLAVCNLSFNVSKKECFGLLGVNGAGKTSTFQMITDNTTISRGDIKIDGIDIQQNEDAYKKRFGYCPQNDCLNNYMTSYEMLKYMATLRGLKSDEIENEVTYWLEKLHLQSYQNVQIRHYSGGTKRKLNAAIAMIASPSIVMLDEPTTGVDPVSRRFLWKCIQDFQNRQNTIVLTSHSMDECEHLCNRLGIMAGGKFECSGNIPELKHKYGNGFTIKVKLNTEVKENCHLEITKRMTEYFPDCTLRENHDGMLTYLVSNKENMSWSTVFTNTQDFSARSSDSVEQYSVNECTLEDIFLKSTVNNPEPSLRSESIVEIG